MNTPVSDVVILQHRLLQYRMTLFDKLRAGCAARGVRLHLVHGQASAHETSRGDTGNLPWANVVRNRYARVGERDLLWQPYPAALRRADLVVLMQENRILSNYPWLFGRGADAPRVAYWGHGRNFQSRRPAGWRERWKAAVRNRVDWWFAYTDMSRGIVVDGGYPPERVTVLDNAIDNDGFAAELAKTRPEQIAALRRSVDADPDALALYCGSLYADKRLDLLVAAGDRAHATRPDFRLVVVGDGPSRGMLHEAARSRPWLHAIGARRGADKASWFRAADIYLSPGAVGLHVLDAFCAGLPLITTTGAAHGPELAYLQTGRNGYIVAPRADAIADVCLRLMGSAQERASVRATAAADAQRYTLDNMVHRFVGGIEACLTSEPLR